MITKTFHDIYDVVELIETLNNANIDISMQNGLMHFSVTYYPSGDFCQGEMLKIGGTPFILAYHENVERAYQAILEKISSGKWENNDGCA